MKSWIPRPTDKKPGRSVPAAREAVVRQEMDVVSFAPERRGFLPDRNQEELLRSNAKQAILNCSRQWGKSTVAAIKAVHRAHTVANSLVVVASPSDRQSAEFLRKARGLARKLGVVVRGDGHKPDEFAVTERVEDCGAAGERWDDSRVLCGEPANRRRSFARA